jgi:Mg-chelatase subunit ChlD/TolB-like protein
VDEAGKPIADAQLTVSAGGTVLMRAKTYADGRTLFFPSEYNQAFTSYNIDVAYKNTRQTFTIDRNGERRQTLTLPITQSAAASVPTDILFVLDTTGSMSEEIKRLRDMLLIIHDNLQAVNSSVDLRFGMVMYRDEGDDYVTETIPFTNDVTSFQKALRKLEAGGGGDTPEDLQTALKVAVNDMDWRTEGVRLTYVITDAAAHIDYGQSFTLLSASKIAQTKGIKLFSVGTGSLDIAGEIDLRQIAQYTMARYIFLTYGERGDSDGGVQGSVSHHTGANFTAENLESIIIRLSRDEMNAYAGRNVAGEVDDYFQAAGTDDRLAVLTELFNSMVTQLISYSGMRISPSTTVAVLPLTSDKALGANAEYFTEQLAQAVANNKDWTAVERRDLQAVLDEYSLRLSGLTDEDASQLGSLLNAQLLISGTVYAKDDGYEIYIKMLRAETGEVLSVTRAKLDKALGL